MPDDATDMLAACADMIGRTGAKTFSIRYCDEEQPPVWFAIGAWPHADVDYQEVTAAFTPQRAALRLLEIVVAGGKCTHCERPTGLEPDSLDTMPANDLICWYQYDPELKTFRRGCEAA